MVANNDNRVDTTFIGWLLIGFVLLLFGVLGLQWAEVFGEYATAEQYMKMPLDNDVLASVCGVVGLILVLLTIFAYRTGNKLSSGVFAFFGFFLIAMYFDNMDDSLVYNSDWFLYVAFAIFFLIIAIYALVAKAPKFVALALLLAALTVFFIGLSWLYDWCGPCYNNDVSSAMCIVFAIFAFLGFVIATYLGLAYANPKKIPLI